MDGILPRGEGELRLQEALQAAGLSAALLPHEAVTRSDGRLVATARAGRALALLATDEHGAVTFHLPQPAPARVDAIAFEPPGAVTFVVPAERVRDLEPTVENVDLDLAPPPPPLLHVIEPLVGDVIGDEFAKTFGEREVQRRCHRIRHVDTDGKNFVAGADVTDAELAALAGRRVLMFVHGIFSTTSATFHGLCATTVAELRSRYDAAICFDHPTVSVSPQDNVAWLVPHLPDGVRFDLITHSRGGLVARLLAGQANSLLDAGTVARLPSIERVAFVGTPNHGSAIVDAGKWGHLIDRLATMAKLFGGVLGNPVAFLAELLEVLKAAATEAAVELPGLSSMLPTSELITTLAAGDAGAAHPEYHLIDSDFTPAGFLHHVFALKKDLVDVTEALVDTAVFGHASNDVAVPVSSVGSSGGSGFPIDIASGHHFTPPDEVWHCSYFVQEQTQKLLGEWFAEEPAPTG